MSNIKILIVEDDPLFALDLKILIDELGYELVGIVDNAASFFEELEKKAPDLVLMDVKIRGELTGIEIAKRLKANKNDTAIIFITSFDDRKYYEEIKDMPHFGYLIKPFNKLTLESTIELAVMALGDESKNTQQEENNEEEFQGWTRDLILREHIFIKRNSKLEKVKIDDIIFIQSEGNYCVISTEKKKYALKMSLIKVKKMLDARSFARVNKRHVLNMNLITSIDLPSNKININDISFSMGRTYKEGLLKKLKILS